ncbi:uncharacterized protein LOC142337232 [Convolutriloba macropyga]|uniref:uncharacterized protein LOC142337232 n=1 Tax=Convolutriloba macropyga TaxID=536237 RepID=UPI003F526D74
MNVSSGASLASSNSAQHQQSAFSTPNSSIIHNAQQQRVSPSSSPCPTQVSLSQSTPFIQQILNSSSASVNDSNPMGYHHHLKTEPNDTPEPLREQDRFLPIANVARIMKAAVPKSGKIAKDAKECVQECVSEFISFITSEASEKCALEKRKTINGEDLIYAMQQLGFDSYVEPLRIYLQKYRESIKGEKLAVSPVSSTNNNNNSVVTLQINSGQTSTQLQPGTFSVINTTVGSQSQQQQQLVTATLSSSSASSSAGPDQIYETPGGGQVVVSAISDPDSANQSYTLIPIPANSATNGVISNDPKGHHSNHHQHHHQQQHSQQVTTAAVVAGTTTHTVQIDTSQLQDLIDTSGMVTGVNENSRPSIITSNASLLQNTSSGAGGGGMVWAYDASQM